MYERSAIVLEKYIEEILRFDKTYNLKKNTQNYIELIKEIENFQITTNKDIKIIKEFDDTVKIIENIQKEQQKLFENNKKLEEDRNVLFGELGEDFKLLESKLKKIENSLEKNNEKIKKLRQEFIKNLQDFTKKQQHRNKCDKERRVSEARNIKYIEMMNKEFGEINTEDVSNLKDFIESEKEQVKKDALDIMIKNGKNERIPFNKDVLKKAINNRVDIAEKEAECYNIVYDKMKKVLSENETESIKLDKYKKVVRDITVKLAFLEAQKEYIVGLLDYERMTAISGIKVHNKLMLEACNNFELDMIQIKKLYELLLKETTNKATQKSYKELYNKNYLRNIEEKEKNFEEETNNVNLKVGTIINSNYWRIEGIKNIYNVFQDEISKNFERDFSEYKIEDEEEYDEDEYEDNNYNNNYDDDDDYDENFNYFNYYKDDDEEDAKDDAENEEDDDDDDDNIDKFNHYFEGDDIDKIIKNSRKDNDRKLFKFFKK